VQTCYRHPDRRAGVICQRCDRPICPACMNQASVGFHCPECTRSSAQRVVPGPVAMRQGAVNRTLLTRTLIGINLVVFVLGLGGMDTRDAFVIDGGLIGEALVRDGAGVRLIGVGQGEWWRLVTSGFLHANLLHVGMNCLLLYQLGLLLEPLLGRLRFGLVYAVALLGGSFGALLLDPDALTVGASGAVYGLMGVALAVFRSRGISAFDTGLGGLLVLNLVLTFAVPGISVGGHLGGLAAGFVAGTLLVPSRQVRLDPSAALSLTVALGAALVVGALVVA